MASVCGQENTVKIKYNGSVGTHLVPSPMRRYPNYGLHTNGDVFCVSTVDQEVAPTVFVLYEEPKKDDAKGLLAEPPAQPGTVVTESVWTPDAEKDAPKETVQPPRTPRAKRESTHEE